MQGTAVMSWPFLKLCLWYHLQNIWYNKMTCFGFGWRRKRMKWRHLKEAATQRFSERKFWKTKHDKFLSDYVILIAGLLHATLLTLPAPCLSESYIKIKINLNFYFHTLWCLKRFYEGLKAFIKPFETPQRSVKIKI